MAVIRADEPSFQMEGKNRCRRPLGQGHGQIRKRIRETVTDATVRSVPYRPHVAPNDAGALSGVPETFPGREKMTDRIDAHGNEGEDGFVG